MWKNIPSYPGYEVSDNGEVRSWHPRNGKGSYKTTKNPTVLTPNRFVDSNYLRVALKCPKEGKHMTKRVHHLVLEAFIGPKPNGFVVMHLNDDTTDNRLSNLKYATNQENSDDMVSKGRSAKGSNHPKSIVSDEVRESIIDLAIKKDYRGSRLEIAELLSLPVSTVYSVIGNYNISAIKEGKQVAKIKNHRT